MQPPICASHCSGKLFAPIPEHEVPQRESRKGSFLPLFTIGARRHGNGPKLRFTKYRQKVTILDWNGAAPMGIAMCRTQVFGRAERLTGCQRARWEARPQNRLSGLQGGAAVPSRFG